MGNDGMVAPDDVERESHRPTEHDRFFLNHQQIVKGKAGTYRSQRFVGRGGNGTTFLVTSIDGPFKGVQFALKVFHKISNERRLAAFLAEVEYYKGLQHPSVIRYFDEGEYRSQDRAYPFVLVEYVPRNLQKFISESSRRIERATALRFMLGIASALRYLHDFPLIHRDIKPGNILISGEKARLADFGLAKSLEEAAEDEPKDIRDEIVYAAMPRSYRTPELVRRAQGDRTPLTPASDIYQFGSVFYEVMTGFNPQETPEKITDEIALNLREIPGEGGARSFQLIQCMLAFNPSDRPSSETVLDELLLIHRDYCFRAKELTGHPF